MANVVKLWSKIINHKEPDITMELDHITFSKKHGHEICVMHLVGKNIFPKMTTAEILSSPQSVAGISADDLITITRLDEEIKNRKNTLNLIEYDRNGTVVLENGYGERVSYSEKCIAENVVVLDALKGRDAYRMGYRVGMKEGCSIKSKKETMKNKILSYLGLQTK